MSPIKPASIKSLMVALIPSIPTGMWYYIQRTILLEKESSRSLYLALPTTVALSL